MMLNFEGYKIHVVLICFNAYNQIWLYLENTNLQVAVGDGYIDIDRRGGFASSTQLQSKSVFSLLWFLLC